MTAETLSFILGGLLIVTGIIGGGFEVKELKIPTVRWPTRLISILGGIFFIGLAMELPSNDSQANGSQAHVSQAHGSQATESNIRETSSQSVDFTIHDELGDGQVSEQVEILLNGRRVGAISVNEHFPTSEITVTVPSEGRYSYIAEAAAVFTSEGNDFEVYGTGLGMIDIEPDKKFRLAGSFSGSTWLISLVEDAE
jgi:hypothetical protein